MCSLHEDWGINCCEFHVAVWLDFMHDNASTIASFVFEHFKLESLGIRRMMHGDHRWSMVILHERSMESWNQRHSETSPPVGVSGGPFGIEPQKLPKTSLANFRHTKNSPWFSPQTAWDSEKEITWNHLSHPKLSPTWKPKTQWVHPNGTLQAILDASDIDQLSGRLPSCQARRWCDGLLGSIAIPQAGNSKETSS